MEDIPFVHDSVSYFLIFTRSSQLIFSILLQHNISDLSRYS